MTFDFVSKSAPVPFIVGVGRSGTTLLRLMLDAHPDLAIPSETHFLASFLAAGSEVANADQMLSALINCPTWPNFGVAEETLRNAVEQITPFSISEGVRAFYRLYAKRLGKARWGDKTPPYRTIMASIERLLPEAHFIHMIRDGRDTTLSYRGLWFGPGDDVEAQARFWAEQILLVRKQMPNLKHCLEVRYEALVSEPYLTLKRVCAFLDLPFHPSMLLYHQTASSRLSEIRQAFGPGGTLSMEVERFVAIHDRTKQPPDPTRLGRWKSEMPDDQQKKYEAVAGPLLRNLGYETRFSALAT
jgi:hypothetical protein